MKQIGIGTFINESVLNYDPQASGNTRLDKADILELTVGYLRNCRNLRVTPYSRIGHAQQAGTIYIII